MQRWFVYCLLAVVFWGAWAVIPKKLGMLSGSQQQALSTVGLIPILLALALSKSVRAEQKKLRGCVIAVVAGVASGLGNLAYYAAMGEGGSKASVLAPLTALYPVLVVVLAMLFLRERPSPPQFAGIALALASIYTFNPIESARDLSQLAGGATAFAAIGLWAVSGTLQKVAADTVSGKLATLCFLGAFIPLAGFLAAREERQWSFSLETWLWLTLLGLTFGLGNLLYLAACSAGAKASVAAPLSGLYPLVAVPLAVIFFGETIGPREGAGIALATLAVVGLSVERKPVAKDSLP